MFKISRKQAIIRLSIITTIITTVISATAFFVARKATESKVNASEVGADLTISRGRTIEYDNSNTGVYTVHVEDPDGDTVNHRAYCAQPSKTAPSETKTYKVNKKNNLTGNTETDNMIKLIIYIREHPKSATSVRSTIFAPLAGSSLPSDDVYAWTHAIIGRLYEGHYHDITDEHKQFITNTVLPLLRELIGSNDIVWQKAQNYDTYLAQVDDGAQDMVWAETADPESASGSITVQKCDAEITTVCLPQGNATFEGIQVAAYDKTNLTTPVATAYLNASGTATFNELPAGASIKYVIKEIATNTSYQNSSPAAGVEIALKKDGQRATVEFDDVVNKGKLTINKIDGATGSCVHAGPNINFEGTTFTVINSSTNSIYYGGNVIASGGTVATITFTATQCNAELDGLPYGAYTIQETAGSAGYTIVDGNPRTISIPSDIVGYNVSTTFGNNPVLGSIKVNKIDKETGTTTTISDKYTLIGTTFQLINNTGGDVFYGGATYGNGQVMDTKSIATCTADNCGVQFDNLPYGNYQVKESAVGTNSPYYLDTEPRNFTIPTNGQANLTYTFENQPIRGDVKIVKQDPANNIPMSNAVFSISAVNENNQITETHIVVSDENGVVDTSANPHSRNTNGYDPIYDSIDARLLYSGYGTWFGKNREGQQIPVNDNVGALPYGTYIIQELRCDANMFCTDIINQKTTINVTEHNHTIDLGDWNNTCAVFSIETEATDDSDGDHYVEAGKNTKIKDHVSYCAKKNYPFTITGTLMDKETGQPFLVNGEKVEQTTEITPTEDDCGTLDMYFEIDTSEIAGKSLVVFEKMYYKESLKASHEEINDAAQTIDIVSLDTVATDEKDGDKFIVEGEATTIIDTVEYCTIKDNPFVIKGILMDKTTGEPLLINGEKVEQIASVLYAPTENCGTLEMSYELEDTTGLAGKPIVVYETLYKVVPVPGEAGGGTLEKIISHEEIDDDDQTVNVINLSTNAYNGEEGNKVFPLSEDVTVTDKVTYCLKAGLTYTLKGVIMDKSTGNGLLVNSAPVEQTLTFTPEEDCGDVKMYFDFNTTDLPGAKLVVFETLYYNDEPLIEHHDIDDEDQSFEIDLTAPETGAITKKDGGLFSQPIIIVAAIVVIAPVTAYFIHRHNTKKHFKF